MSKTVPLTLTGATKHRKSNKGKSGPKKKLRGAISAGAGQVNKDSNTSGESRQLSQSGSMSSVTSAVTFFFV